MRLHRHSCGLHEPSHAAGVPVRGSGLLNAHAFFGKDFLGQVNREAERIAEQERVLTGENVPLRLVQAIAQQAQALVDRLGEAGLLHTDQLCDGGALLVELLLRIGLQLVDTRLLALGRKRLMRSATSSTSRW